MAAFAIDLCCGLGGWTEGLLAEGYDVVGFDTERHVYGDARYPAQLVLQDVRTLHGAQFKDAALIVASPPCQAYSYRAMPWSRAKALPPPDNALFDACFRIQREASEAAGHLVPLVVENVCGAQKWVGRARWHFGSFYLWGDVPALMPITRRAKVGGLNWSNFGKADYKAEAFNSTAEQRLKATKNDGGSWFSIAHNTTSGHGQNPDGRLNTIANAADGCKQQGSGAAWWRGEVGMLSSKSSARKAASAHIAKIPVELARHIGRCWYPEPEAQRDGVKVPGNKLSDNGFAIPVARLIDKSKKPAAFRLSDEDRRQHLSYSRKAASAQIAKIPIELARHVARAWYPHAEAS